MSWHNSGIFVHADFSDNPHALFALLGRPNPRRRPDWDAILGDTGDSFPNGLGFIACDGWSCNFGFEASAAIMDSRLDQLAARANLFAWELEGTCGHGSYQLWKGGKKVRHWAEQEGEILVAVGAPLFEKDDLAPGELGSEERVFLAMETLAISIAKLWEQPLTAYEFPSTEFPRTGFREWVRRWLRF